MFVDPPASSRELDTIRKHFTTAKEKAAELAGDLNAEQLNARPDPRTWSVGENLHHLVIVGSKTADRMEHGMAAGRQRGLMGAGPYKYGRLGNWFVNAATDPESGFKTPAPAIFEPKRPQEPEPLLHAFRELQDRLLAIAQDADGLDLGRIRVRSPASWFVRLSLGQWFALLAGHQLRHFAQAREARRRLGYDTAEQAPESSAR